MIVINGIVYQLINVLFILMQAVGPTPVAGIPGGTTAAFLQPSHAAAQAHIQRLR